MIILGIETSCDETGIALYDTERGLIADALFSQIDLHVDYGGVVPELASRDHIRKTLPLVDEVIAKAGIKKHDISAVAYTAGPGLIGALLVGSSIAQALAYALGVPSLGVHHMEGHLLAPMLEESPPDFPFVGLLVSGGHTQLVAVEGIGRYKILGESLDDAAGEAFDKAAKMLGLDYPGGPRVAHWAEQARKNFEGTPYRFPRPMIDRPGLDFSFSGLKTYTLNTVQAITKTRELTEQDVAEVSLAFEDAVVDTLRIKCKRALEETGYKRLVIAGGVSANKSLRAALHEMEAKTGSTVFYARPEFCTDNGAMIAYAGAQRLNAGQRDNFGVTVRPRWPMDELPPIEGL